MFHDTRFIFRMKSSLQNRLKPILERDKHIFKTRSDFIRVAIVKLLRERESVTQWERAKERFDLAYDELEDSK